MSIIKRKAWKNWTESLSDACRSGSCRFVAGTSRRVADRCGLFRERNAAFAAVLLELQNLTSSGSLPFIGQGRSRDWCRFYFSHPGTFSARVRRKWGFIGHPSQHRRFGLVVHRRLGEGEEVLMRTYPDLKTDVLKIGHHGKRNIQFGRFLGSCPTWIGLDIGWKTEPVWTSGCANTGTSGIAEYLYFVRIDRAIHFCMGQKKQNGEPFWRTKIPIYKNDEWWSKRELYNGDVQNKGQLQPVYLFLGKEDFFIEARRLFLRTVVDSRQGFECRHIQYGMGRCWISEDAESLPFLGKDVWSLSRIRSFWRPKNPKMDWNMILVGWRAIWRRRLQRFWLFCALQKLDSRKNSKTFDEEGCHCGCFSISGERSP